MSDILIFGGTTEGRELAEFCEINGVSADVSVATDYGAELLTEGKYVHIISGRKDVSEIVSLIQKNKYSAVIDATHPYAVEVTKNISFACSMTAVKYLRLSREENTCEPFGKYFDTIDEVVEYLNESDGVILSTLGSKSLSALTGVKSFYDRVWLRILPADGIEKQCADMGFDTGKLILLKGPFTADQNEEHIRMSGAQILVTKESGVAGGYEEKLTAAKNCGIEAVTLKRPADNGMSADEIRNEILICI